MKWVLEQVSDADLEVVTVEQVKLNMGEFASVTARDVDLLSKIVTARKWAEWRTGRVLVDQTWRLTIGPDNFNPSASSDSTTTGTTVVPAGGLYLRRSPALAVVSVASVDSAGAETAVAAEGYELREADSKWPNLVLLNGGSWGTGVNRITFRAGFADRTGSPVEDATVVPECFKQAIMLHVEAHYDKDAVMMEKLLKAAECLLKPERCEMGFA